MGSDSDRHYLLRADLDLRRRGGAGTPTPPALAARLSLSPRSLQCTPSGNYCSYLWDLKEFSVRRDRDSLIFFAVSVASLFFGN